jgi:hypothetical protein
MLHLPQEVVVQVENFRLLVLRMALMFLRKK